MKKNSAITQLLTVLLLAGCSQNEVTDVNPDSHPAVGFGVYTGLATRGVDMTTESMKDSPSDAEKYGGFGIMGYFTGQETFENVKNTVTAGYMYNQAAEYDSKTSAWTYSPVKYWPNRDGDKISFFAYAPYESNGQSGTKTGITISAATEAGIPYINFSLKKENELTKMVDLVVADALDQQYTQANGGKVSFNFKHTLSRISFKAKLGSGDFTGMDGNNSFVYITHMWIVGKDHGTTAESGNLSLTNLSAASNTGSKFYTSAKWSQLHWNYENAIIPDKDFSLDNILALEKEGIIETDATTGHEGSVKGIKLTAESQKTPVSLFPEKQYLYLIPVGDNDADVTKNSGCAEGDIKIGFHYDIVTKDNTSSGSSKYIASHAESVISLPKGHMKRNESYLYTLQINLHEIKIEEAKVENWSDITNDVTIE